jgi:hypothetical protein
MKIRVERDKIIKAVKKLEEIEIVLDNAGDAKEAIDLILRKTSFIKVEFYEKVKDIAVTASQEYKTSSVDYNTIFTLEFNFEEDTAVESKVAFIRDLQDFFNKL